MHAVAISAGLLHILSRIVLLTCMHQSFIMFLTMTLSNQPLAAGQM